MKTLDTRKIKIWLIRNKNLINFLKICIIILLGIFIRANEKFIIYIFYLLIFDSLVLIHKDQRFCKYIINVFILFNILVERLIYIDKNFNIVNLTLAILYIIAITLAIKIDLFSNRVKYNFTLWDDLKNVISKDRALIVVKILIITSMLLIVKVKILLIIIIGIFNLFQLFIGNSEVDRIRRTILDLLIFLISALFILFKADIKSIVENPDMTAILGILAIVCCSWVIENKKN